MFTKTTQSEQHQVVDPEEAKRRLAALREAALAAQYGGDIIGPERADNVRQLSEKRV